MPPGLRPASRRRLPLWSIIGFAVVAGLAIGRFATFDGGAAETAPTLGTPAAAATLEEQVAALEAAVEAKPDDGRSWGLLGTVYARRAVEVGDPSFYELSKRAFDRASELAPGDPTVLLGRGALALSLHRFDEAEVLGREAVAELPSNAQALGVLVDAQVELGQYEAAATTLQEMLDVRPGLAALARTSYLRELNGDLDGAKEAMRRAVLASTSSSFDVASVTALLGGLLLVDGDLDEALGRYDEALRVSPGHIEAELGRARVLAARGEIDQATTVVEGVVERFPAPVALVLLAELQYVAGEEEAEQETADLVRLTAVLQQDAGQVVDLELSLFEADLADDPARAVELAQAAYDARPDNVFAADALAWALNRAGEEAAAVPFAEQAVRLGTTNPLLQYHAAEVFAAVDDDARAVEHLERAFVAGPAFSVRHADAAAALAERLGVVVPAAT